MIDLVNAVVRKSLRHDLARLTRFKAGREGIETFIKVTLGDFFGDIRC